MLASHDRYGNPDNCQMSITMNELFLDEIEKNS